MSDDPASIEAWQQQMRDDIVTRLRGHISITTRIHYAKDGYPEPVYVHGPSPICQEAADEIERLRARIAELKDDRIQLGGGALQRFMENPDD